MDFGDGKEVLTVSNPWRADILSAGKSTSVPNIDGFASFPGAARFLMKRPGFMESRFGKWMAGGALGIRP